MRWLVVIPLAAGCLCSSAFGQYSALDSYQRARVVLDRFANACGGVDRIRGIENFTIKASGYLVLRNQSRQPFALDRAPRQIEIAVDLKRSRFREEERTEFPSGNRPHESLVVDGGKGVSIDHVRGTRFDQTNV